MTKVAHYDIPIDDPLLTRHGFSKFSLPLGRYTPKIILHNDIDKSLITYIDFHRHDLDKSVKCFEDKLLDEQQIESKIGKDTVTGLVAYFRKTCVSLSEDSDNIFFKNRKGESSKSTKKKSNKKSAQLQQEQHVDHDDVDEAVGSGGIKPSAGRDNTERNTK